MDKKPAYIAVLFDQKSEKTAFLRYIPYKTVFFDEFPKKSVARAFVAPDTRPQPDFEEIRQKMPVFKVYTLKTWFLWFLGRKERQYTPVFCPKIKMGTFVHLDEILIIWLNRHKWGEIEHLRYIYLGGVVKVRPLTE